MSNPLTKSQFDSIIRDNVLKHSGLKSSPLFEAKDGEKAYTKASFNKILGVKRADFK